ncbi:xylulokinase [Bauldia litoralis]|uniref:Xylulose kinase n=1 Tax=Bauldia litoralis TaxID=665467 RepID=A0A1G6CFZ8_9HYPH|nr:xylulokinase [Bauldia litoralis]SDB31799.1 xylulokinase [Bauldia litoralis]
MYLGIDIGTSSLKAVLIDDGQRIVGSRSMSLDVSRPHSGWSEQDPESWWTACGAVLDGLAADHRAEMAAVRGIGLSGQMHGATLLDEADKVLRPCILWNDGRSAAEAAEISTVSERVTGNIAMPGFTAPKLMWVKNHEPEIFARVRTVLLPKDYVRLRLTGDKASDMSDSAGTLWLETAKRAWSDEMLALTGMDRSQMPELFEGSAATGTLNAELASRWGMTGKVVVAGGGGDNAASGCGVGAVAPGTGFISIGTSGVIFVTADRYRGNPAGAVHAFCHAVPGTWHQMGVSLSSAGCLDWLGHILEASPGDLVDALGDKPEGPSSILFLPYLSGERTPHNDVAIRGAFVGLDQADDRRAMTQAVLEGVAFAFKDCLDVLTMPLAEPRRLLAVGGGSRSRYWLSTIATILGMPIAVPEDGDFGAAFGAARLGLIAAEDADPFAVCAPPAIRETIDPIAGLSESYAAAHATYCDLYPAIKEAMPR